MFINFQVLLFSLESFALSDVHKGVEVAPGKTRSVRVPWRWEAQQISEGGRERGALEGDRGKSPRGVGCVLGVIFKLCRIVFIRCLFSMFCLRETGLWPEGDR